jgi:hypothetical protein
VRTDASGPFGHALYFNQGYIYAESPRAGFDNGPLDLSGERPFTLTAWMKFTGARHMVAGIWDEGGWDKYRGRRQAALFGGLFGRNGITAHISASGAAVFNRVLTASELQAITFVNGPAAAGDGVSGAH